MSIGSARRVSSSRAGALTLHEFEHSFDTATGSLAVRTFLTEGLTALGAPEVRASVPHSWREDAVAAARQLLWLQEHLAAAGRPPKLGSIVGFEAPTLADGVMGVTYARGRPVDGIPEAGSALVAVLLQLEELILARRGLTTRVLGALAWKERYFPYPPWWEIRTRPVLSLTEQAQSLLDRLHPVVEAGDVRLTLVDETLWVSLPEAAAERFRALWAHSPQTRALALLGQLAPDADGQVVWVPGEKDLHIVTVAKEFPRRLGHAFVVLAQGQQARVLRVEDGLCLMLPALAFEALKEALTTGRSLSLPLDGRLLRITFRPSTLIDPFTGTARWSADGWERWLPEGPRPPVGRVTTEEVVLLLPFPQLQTRVETRALAEVVGAVEEIVDRVASAHPVEAQVALAIGLVLSPGASPRVQLASRSGSAPELIGQLQRALMALPPVEVRREVPFCIEARVHPGPVEN